jgi:glycosyltransferase involved in cell wall biosynthesis
MAAGLPCAISEACNFPEAGAAGAARVFPTGDADRLAAVLSDLLEHRTEARDMGGRARELVSSRYTWPRIAEALEKQLGAILLSPGRANR